MVRWQNGIRVVEPQINANGVHIYPFDASFPIDVRFFTLRGRSSVRMNRHNYFELCHVSAGRTDWQIQDRHFSVHKGDLVVIGRDLYHRPIDPPDAHSRLTFLFFEPKLISGTQRTGEEMEYLMPFLAQIPDFPHVIPAGTGLPAEILELMNRIHVELPADTGSKRLAARTYLQMILILLVKYYSAYIGTREDLKRKRADLQRLRTVFDLLEERSNQPIQVAYAARLCAMSDSHFMTFFKKTTGQSFHTYLNHFRIAKAQMLLTSTDKPLDTISQEAGFCNQSYFGKMFRMIVGETPRVYRGRMKDGCDIGHVPMSGHSIEGTSEPIRK
jgi:AraC-like DNA-binding protein/mannose-6-phosphate isomerase-like protein (cupin superfamily)